MATISRSKNQGERVKSVFMRFVHYLVNATNSCQTLSLHVHTYSQDTTNVSIQQRLLKNP